MDNVYVVSDRGSSVYGVFSNRAEAEQYKKLISPLVHVTRCTVDASKDILDGSMVWVCAKIKKDNDDYSIATWKRLDDNLPVEPYFFCRSDGTFIVEAKIPNDEDTEKHIMRKFHQLNRIMRQRLSLL